MRYRWTIAGLLAALGLLTGPLAPNAIAQGPGWDLSGNTMPTTPLPTGPYQHDGSGFYTAVEFMMLRMYRNIGAQQVAVRGLVDSAGLLNGTPGAFLGSGEEALNTAQLGRQAWSPGSRLTIGYRNEQGWNFSLSWLHLFDTKSSAGASTQGPNFGDQTFNLENSFLFSPVFNFSPDFTGPVARNTTGGPIATNGSIVFGALNGIWNGASDMTIVYTERFDNWDASVKVPVFETENARTYAIAGGRFSWIWERFMWRTTALGIDVDNIALGAPPQQTSRPEWAARYLNTLSQRMYGPMIGTGHEVWLGSGFSLDLECTGSVLLDIAKQRAKYVREDQATQSKRAWTDFRIVPNFNVGLNLTWQPLEGVTIKAGYNALNYFNTLQMTNPIGFNFGQIDPGYTTKAYRILHGANVGVGFVW
jgi:hypothetical protein